MMLENYNWQDLGPETQAELLERPAQGIDASIRDRVAGILQQVRTDGDAAVRALTAEIDGVDVADCRVAADEFAAAAAALSRAAVDAIDLAISNVRRFHEAQLPGEVRIETMPGVLCERLTHALDSVGLYVPAGTAPLPSAAIMLAVPAAIAGCPVRVLCTPPRPDGTADPAVLVAASRAGITDVFKIGGAQAVAAMAYGTASVPKVRKIFGPGNAWVTAAKTLVSSDPDGAAIDLPAGPSEVLVIADDSARPGFVAADLLSQAEHGTDSQVMLVTTSPQLAREVADEVEAQLELLSRADIAREALAQSRIITVDSIDAAIAISNRYAPEHLILQFRDARAQLGAIRNAGSVFIGDWSPESVGDYCSGTNHVLPTYGYASAYSGLGIDQFMRHMTVQELSQDGLASLGTAITTLADLEGLDAHAAAVTLRLETEA
ncbi:MAG: histidinol dehydrogenase [Woeseiaceae bacterium]|nr:histidinol dehydrogenase [Woeseiaceae bacterium]